MLCLLMVSVMLSACAKQEKQDTQKPDREAADRKTSAETMQIQEETQEETQQTEQEVRYELQSVRLCTGYVTTQTENGRSRGYEFDYDEYGRMTYQALYFDGALHGYHKYYFDDVAQTAYKEYYNADGVMESTTGTLITGIQPDIGGMPEERHGNYVYNEDGYIIEESGSNGVKRYTREYDESYSRMTEIGHLDDEKQFLSREVTLDPEGKFLTEIIYNENGTVSMTKVYSYDEAGRVLRIDNDIPDERWPLNYPWIYQYDEYGDLVLFDVDYYYGYETQYTYASYDVWMPVSE